MNAAYPPDFSTDKDLARRLGRPSPKSSVSGDFMRFAGSLDGSAAAAFVATALFGAIVIFSVLEAVNTGSGAGALTWGLTAVTAGASAALLQLLRRSADEKVQLREEAERLRADAERLRLQMRGEAAFFGGLGGDGRY